MIVKFAQYVEKIFAIEPISIEIAIIESISKRQHVE